MCWNEQVSLNTFLFSSFVLLLIIYNNTYTQYKIHELNNVWIYVFMALVISIQLAEFFIWRNINNKKYNHLFSVITMIILHMQPIASLMILSNTYLRNSLLAAYLMIIIPSAIYKLSTKYIYSVIGKSGHLRWNFYDLYPPLDLLVWLFFFLFSFFYEKKWVGIVFGISTLILSYANYYQYHTMGSMWCWSVNSAMIYFAFYLLIYLPFLEKSKIC